jgi:hypothetical protein
VPEFSLFIPKDRAERFALSIRLVVSGVGVVLGLESPFRAGCEGIAGPVETFLCGRRGGSFGTGGTSSSPGTILLSADGALISYFGLSEEYFRSGVKPRMGGSSLSPQAGALTLPVRSFDFALVNVPRPVPFE